jgi:SanA protein
MISGSLPSPLGTVNVRPAGSNFPFIPLFLVKSTLGERMLRLSRFFIFLTLAIAIFTLPRWFLTLHFSQDISESEDAPSGPIAIVFGAGLRRDGRPTTVLADRVQTAAQLYKQGKVEKILMTGSAHGDRYDESKAMRDYAISLGVDEEDILLDSEGDRTFLSCLRARDEFGISKALLVSQRYHLPRALILCETLGIEADGVASDLRTYRAQSFWSARESIATLRALWDAGRYKLETVFKSQDAPIF